MPRTLSEAELQHYEEHGYIFPVPALSSEEVGRYRAGLEKYLQLAQGTMRPSYKHKLHLVARWADELVHHPRILDAVEDILGPECPECLDERLYCGLPQFNQRFPVLDSYQVCSSLPISLRYPS